MLSQMLPSKWTKPNFSSGYLIKRKLQLSDKKKAEIGEVQPTFWTHCMRIRIWVYRQISNITKHYYFKSNYLFWNSYCKFQYKNVSIQENQGGEWLQLELLTLHLKKAVVKHCRDPLSTITFWIKLSVSPVTNSQTKVGWHFCCFSE